ncbi:MAG: FkbM family methyltransferase [Verrucomicrobiia bacterium]
MSLTRYANLIANIKNWETYFAHKHFHAGRAGADVEYLTRRGFRLAVPPHRFAEFKEVFVQQVYWPECWKGVDPGTIRRVIDVGANIGFFTLFAVQKFPMARVVAVEPIRENHARLVRLLEGNPDAAAKALHLALAGHGNGITLRFDATEVFTTAATIFDQSSYRPDWSAEVVKEEQVPSLTLEALLEQEGVERCDLLKLDCEGSEYEILYGADPGVLRRIQRVAIETHPGPKPEQRPEALEAFLGRAGFRTWSREAMLYGERS